jgi:hypothetical protein
MSGKDSGSGLSAEGYSQWMNAEYVAVTFLGLIPHANRTQYGAPEPPVKRENLQDEEVRELHQ